MILIIKVMLKLTSKINGFIEYLVECAIVLDFRYTSGNQNLTLSRNLR